MNVRNALIFTEDGNLFVRKPNGLEYEFQNVTNTKDRFM